MIINYAQKDANIKEDMLIKGEDRMVGYATEDIKHRQLQKELADAEVSDDDSSPAEVETNRVTKIYK